MTHQINALTPRFVEFIPKQLEPAVLYISIEYTTTAHACACGCGERVVLPLRPTDWKLIFDGQSITMRPSVGNWGFPCRSHYLITGNQIEWASDWSAEQIRAGRRRDRVRRTMWEKQPAVEQKQMPEPEIRQSNPENWFRRMWKLIFH